MGKDPCSYSDDDIFCTKSIHFDWAIDFSRHVIGGTATLLCHLKQKGTKELTFDSNALQVDRITCEGENLQFVFG